MSPPFCHWVKPDRVAFSCVGLEGKQLFDFYH